MTIDFDQIQGILNLLILALSPVAFLCPFYLLYFIFVYVRKLIKGKTFTLEEIKSYKSKRSIAIFAIIILIIFILVAYKIIYFIIGVSLHDPCQGLPSCD